ncbi:methyl-accepting chemotaxis protein [Vibrio vulnificus]|uniref:methyl-accepting chemotaxis protein n=1 Tax=Vibrio vulnificus TaxID=672 RepID=UPI0003071B6F|nr:methyl-accepting chemotaxis protein [Vibrio vulnificus]ASM97199.1 chemotaxis protein [Vibrio vulnificus NBRC 15645 = ATCC 27562]EGQ7998480.1 methyl-accepting chemotaxis protein [Vibrio vulnificus]EJE8692362.1 methyl-accepting chemotaxis protein [Vibrio vulnificus]ELF6470491.1 methyl-accepting chemotaxis protein [Vibrio vulnificus]MCL7018365.1 methyl-accepting chemotaxis protein [Vibrio vulnificus]
MDMLALSQKRKIQLFLSILTLGFVALAAYTSNQLTSLTEQYSQSSRVSTGAGQIAQTQVELLQLTGKLGQLTATQVNAIQADVTHLEQNVRQAGETLVQFDLNTQADNMQQAVNALAKSLAPWLRVKSELGFNVDEGKLGQLKDLAKVIEQKIEETGMVTINSDFQAMIKTQQNYLLQPNEQNMKLFNRAMAMFVNVSNSYGMLDIYEKEIEEFKQTFIRVSELSQQLGALEQQLKNNQREAINLIQQASEQLNAVADDQQQRAASSASETQWSVLIALAALAVFTIVIFLSISVSLTRSLDRISQVIKAVSNGDLSRRLTLSSNANDEFNQLSQSVNESCENLGKLVSEVQESSHSLAGHAGELRVGLDKFAHHQGEILGQTQLLASATEEVSMTTHEVSNSLEFVTQISRASNQAAEDGGKIISEAIGSLEQVAQILNSAAGHISQLEEASSKIDSVMDIINGIAEQTNLLALNAAIEAARAGEQGRGFAVVADEVRSLAVRTVDAVSEITGTIQTMKNESAEVIQYISSSGQTIEKGQQKGHEAMDALKHITAKADEANHQTEIILSSIKELATTSQSMADSMTQISQAMRELESNNGELRDVSQLVDNSSRQLSNECQKFTI